RGRPGVGGVAGELDKDLKAGWSLEESLQKQGGALPPIFVSLTTVGEESGHLPEVLHELENYFTMQLKARREGWGQIAWPLTQFVVAVLIVTMLIYILGILAAARGDGRVDPLGLGLPGPDGAVTFAGTVFGAVLAAVLLYRLLSRLLRRRAVVERALLYVPALGPYLLALALARLSVAGRLLFETGLSVTKSLRLAFQ